MKPQQLTVAQNVSSALPVYMVNTLWELALDENCVDSDYQVFILLSGGKDTAEQAVIHSVPNQHYQTHYQFLCEQPVNQVVFVYDDGGERLMTLAPSKGGSSAMQQ